MLADSCRYYQTSVSYCVPSKPKVRALLIIHNLAFEEPLVIDLLWSRQVSKMGNKKETILINRKKDVKLQMEEKMIEEAQQDQQYLEVEK